MRLKLRERLHAVRVARTLAGKSEEDAKVTLESEGLRFGIDPALLILFLQIGLAIWRYMQDKNVSHLSNTALYDAALTEE